MRRDDLTRYLEERGLRATTPRLRLLAFFAEHSGHFTPEEIFERLRASGEGVSIATLYQNLRTFRERGLLEEVTGPGGELRYDANLVPHHHLVCVSCGRMTDLEFEVPPLALPAPSAGWSVFERRLEVRGLCPDCRARQGA